ncbi:MAG: hypothetical protein KF726_21390 [Anaerolineae bacterium]|nr:hypothetical protein [Anaerolineae bacterium]
MRLLRLSLLVILCASTLIGVTRVLGQQQPAPARVALLELERCKLPCWMGIEVGKTSLEQATNTLMALNDAQPRLWRISTQRVTFSALTGFPRRVQFSFNLADTPAISSSFSVYVMYDDKDIVDGLVLDFFGKDLSFGTLELSDLLVNMAEPTAITSRTTLRSQYDTELNLIFADSFIRPYIMPKEFSGSIRLMPSYRLSSIQIWPRYSAYGAKLVEAFDLRSHWLGFTTHRRQFQNYVSCCQFKNN